MLQHLSLSCRRVYILILRKCDNRLSFLSSTNLHHCLCVFRGYQASYKLREQSSKHNCSAFSGRSNIFSFLHLCTIRRIIWPTIWTCTRYTLTHHLRLCTKEGSGMIFMAMNSSITDKLDSWESTKPKKPCFFAFVVLEAKPHVSNHSQSCWEPVETYLIRLG